MRYTPNAFLDAYEKYLSNINRLRKGAISLTFKRYDAADEQRLPPSNVHGAPHGATKENKKQREKRTRKATPKQAGKAAADPESTPASTTTIKPLDKPSVLVRAVMGTKKVSCVVECDQVVEFQRQFCTIFRAHSTALVHEGQQSDRLKKRIAASQKKPADPKAKK